MASRSNNDNVSEGYDLINGKMYRQLVTGDINGFRHEVTLQQADVLKLRCARDKNSTVLHIAASFGQEHLVNDILSQWPQLMDKENTKGDLAIHSALKTGQLNTFQALISWLKSSNREVSDKVLAWNNEMNRNTVLHLALEKLYDVQQHYYQIVRDLVELYPQACYVMNNKGICPLYLAIKKELTELVKYMLEKMQPFKEDALGSFKNGQSVLHAAVSVKTSEMLEHMFIYDAWELINLMDNEGWTALSYAACMGYLENVQVFEHRVPESAFICNRDESYPIHQAVLGGHINIVDLLSSTMFLLNAKGQNVYHLATLTGDFELVLHLLSLPNADALINERDEDGNTPLHLATQWKHLEVVEVLIQDKRVNVGLSNNEGLTAKELANKLSSAGGDKVVVKRLDLIFERATVGLKCSPIDGNLYRLLLRGEMRQACQIISDTKLHLGDLWCPKDGNNILHLAASMDQPSLVVDLLQRDCAILMGQANNSGDLPIHSAAKAGKLESLKALFQWSNVPADHICERPNMEGNTALHDAVLNIHMEIANFLYTQCPQAAYFLNKDSICPLFLAIKNWSASDCDLVTTMINEVEGNQRILSLLKGAKSIVHIAILYRRKGALQTIIDKAPELMESCDIRGRHPLSYATHMGFIQGVKMLLRRFPDFEFKRDNDKDGSFPIHQAARGGHISVIKLLHPKLCLLNRKGQNILHVAAEAGRWSVVRYLLRLEEFQKLLNARDYDGNTPLHLAVKGARYKTVGVLIQKRSIDGNSTNNELCTPTDMFEIHMKCPSKKLPSSFQKRTMDQMLKSINGKKSYMKESERRNELQGKQTNKETEKDIQNRITAKELSNTLLVVAVLILGSTYAAALSPPGGYDGKTGLPIFPYSKAPFINFTFNNAFAFHMALVSALILLLGMIVEKLFPLCIYFAGFYILGGLINMLYAILMARSIIEAEKASDITAAKFGKDTRYRVGHVLFPIAVILLFSMFQWSKPNFTIWAFFCFEEAEELDIII